nr:D-alanyl-D-alanine carboxypeptidase family protein [Pseudomarimonas arenosa]
MPATPAPAATPIPAAPAVAGRAYVLMDAETGQVLAGQNEQEPLDPASLTKVMTGYVVAAEIAAGKVSGDDQVLISENAWRQGGAGTDGSFSALAVNSQVKLDDVLRGLVIQSGNDAAIALAEHVAGSEAAFADLMNAYANKLGMHNSHFVNSHGLTADGHRMSARDVALLSRALIQQFPEHYALYSVKEYTYNGIKQYNRNGLLWKDATVDGIKTGHTSAAGYCLAASAKRGEQRLVSVVMGIEGSRKEGFRQREEGNLALLNWGFRFFETHVIYPAGGKVSEAKVWKGVSEALPLVVAEPLKLTLPRGRYGEVKASISLPDQVVAPISQGVEIGWLSLQFDGKEVADVPLLAGNAVEEAGFFSRMNDGFWMWWESD